jgi:hypothetical protein
LRCDNPSPRCGPHPRAVALHHRVVALASRGCAIHHMLLRPSIHSLWPVSSHRCGIPSHCCGEHRVLLASLRCGTALHPIVAVSLPVSRPSLLFVAALPLRVTALPPCGAVLTHSVVALSPRGAALHPRAAALDSFGGPSHTVAAALYASDVTRFLSMLRPSLNLLRRSPRLAGLISLCGVSPSLCCGFNPIGAALPHVGAAISPCDAVFLPVLRPSPPVLRLSITVL